MGEKRLKYSAWLDLDVTRLFNETRPDRPPTSQTLVSKVEAKFKELGNVRDLPKTGRLIQDANANLEFMLSLEDTWLQI